MLLKGFLKAKKSRGVIMKLDFSEAFNSVRWDFDLHILDIMNFELIWIRWIKSIF